MFTKTGSFKNTEGDKQKMIINNYVTSIDKFYMPIIIKKKTPILVYNASRSGSTDITHSLREHNLHVYLIHCFNIYHDDMGWNNKYVTFPHRMYIAGLLYKYIKRGGKVKIINPIRDPVEQSISIFFGKYLRRYHVFDSMTNKELLQLFLTQYKHSDVLFWHDLEIKDSLGIDVYKHPFNNGSSIIKKDNIELLVLKLKKKDRVGFIETEIRKFLNLPDFKLHTYERGKNNNRYGDKYKKFLDELQLPDDYVEKMRGTKYAKHFGFDCTVHGDKQSMVNDFNKRNKVSW